MDLISFWSGFVIGAVAMFLVICVFAYSKINDDYEDK